MTNKYQQTLEALDVAWDNFYETGKNPRWFLSKYRKELQEALTIASLQDPYGNAPVEPFQLSPAEEQQFQNAEYTWQDQSA